MTRTFFGRLPDGTVSEIITLNSGEAVCRILTYGATLVSLEVPDKNGNATDVVLGYESQEAYIEHKAYLGALVGRYANRIGGARFTLNGREYTLFANQGKNHLHGGKEGFDKRIWAVEEIPNGARFTLESPHMDEGYPGNLRLTVDYVLEGTSLHLTYCAESDMDTICNPTNHAYFNLDGHSAGSILDHELTLFADFYTPVADRASIPTGEISPVAGTPLDFTTPHIIGERIGEDFPQLAHGGGYDHNWLVRGEENTLRPAAKLRSLKSGISMEVSTDLPGIQFYAGNFMGGGPLGKGGATYENRSGLCLETQFYPDSPNNPQFPSCTLKAGEKQISHTIFRFCK